MERLLVVFPGALGDFVCFVPALAALRRRARGGVTVVCQNSLLDLARICGAQEALPIEGPISAWLFMREPPPAADAFFAQFAVVESFTGFRDSDVRANLKRWGFRAPHPFRAGEPVHFAVHCLRELGLNVEHPPDVRISIPNDWARVGIARRVNNGQSLVVHPGSGGRAKRWSRSGFRALCDRWARAYDNPLVVLGPSERHEADDWRSPRVEVACCETLIELAATLAGASVYLGNDSGVTHLAAALGLRGVALFGPSDERRWAPLGGTIAVLRLEEWRSAEEDAAESSIFEVGQLLTAVARLRLP